MSTSLSVSETRSLKHQFAHRWIIHDFSHLNTCPHLVPPMRSLPFSHPDNPSTQFFLQLHPNGVDSHSSEQIGIFLFLKYTGSSQEVIVSYKFSVIDMKNQKCSLKSSSPTSFVPGGNGFGFYSFIDRKYCFDEANGILFNDQLTIFCEVTIFAARYHKGSLSIKPSSISGKLRTLEQFSMQQVSHNLGSLLERGRFTDLVLVFGCGQFEDNLKEIQVHKIVLISRSPVFAAMFEHDTQESREGRIYITDVSFEIGQLFVRYLYTGLVASIDRYASELLVVADKYGTDLLKQMCSLALSSKIMLDNVVEKFIFADLHSCAELKQACISYIVANVHKVMSTEGWSQLLRSAAHSSLVDEIFKAFVNKIQ